jgi:hypothetical protein
MVGISSTLDTSGIDRFQRQAEGELRAAIPLALTYLKQLCIQVVARMGAIDTLALLLSIYISSWGYSEYDEAMNEAADAYGNNPTKYPGIRAALGNPALKELPELKPSSPDEGWLGVGAAHGIAVEEGYRSFYGNDVPARPFVQDTAAEGVLIVVEEFRKAIQRALR